MKFVTYAQTKFELEQATELNIRQVILSCRELSRSIRNTASELEVLINYAFDLGLEIILEWDILVSESEFEAKVKVFGDINIEKVSHLRIQDLGVLEYVLENTDKKIQYIAETGNANLVGLKYLEEYIAERLDTLILSYQLPKTKLTEFRQQLSCKLEILGLGPILLFYSPRELLSPLIDIRDEFIEATGESEESPHKGFPIVQNQHGTFMYHLKDLCLLEEFSELEKIGIDYFRVDFNMIKKPHLLRQVMDVTNNKLSIKDFKTAYPKGLIKGYYNINKSNVLFSKLKNYRLIRKDKDYLGEVVEAIKDKYIVIKVKSESHLSLGTQIEFVTPEGKNIPFTISQLKSLSLNPIEKINKDQIVLIDYRSGIWNKSQVYLA